MAPWFEGDLPHSPPPAELGSHCDRQHTAWQHGRQHTLLACCRRAASWQTCCGGQTHGPERPGGAAYAGGCQATSRSGGVGRLKSEMHTLTSAPSSVLHLCATAFVGRVLASLTVTVQPTEGRPAAPQCLFPKDSADLLCRWPWWTMSSGSLLCCCKRGGTCSLERWGASCTCRSSGEPRCPPSCHLPRCKAAFVVLHVDLSRRVTGPLRPNFVAVEEQQTCQNHTPFPVRGHNKAAANISPAQLLQNRCCQSRGAAAVSNAQHPSCQLLTPLSTHMLSMAPMQASADACQSLGLVQLTPLSMHMLSMAPMQASADARQSLGLVGQQGRGRGRHDVHVPPCCRRAQVGGGSFAAPQHQAGQGLQP